MDETLHPNQRQRGQSLVELAVSLTFLLILVGGVVDLGRMFFTVITLRDAAQEGAAFGSYACMTQTVVEVKNGTPLNVEACVKDNSIPDLIRRRVREASTGNDSLVDLSNWPDSQITVTYKRGASPLACDISNPGTCACTGDSVTVEVSDPAFEITMPFIGALVGQHIPLKASVTDTVLSPKCPPYIQ